MSGFSHLDFEVFRHALWEVNEEQGVVAVRTSASHVVYESYDMNTAVLDAQGRGLVSGAFVSLHSTTLDAVVASVIETFGDSIRPGDTYITNDPWAGALHLSDYASVSPVFVGDELLFWTGLVMHEEDVGGPVPGSFSVGSHEVWGEAPVVPPMLMARAGKIVPEVEALLLRNSRQPHSARVNMRVRMATAHVGEARLLRIVDKFGLDRVRAGQQQVIDHVAETLRERLRQIPDGVWRERAWIDHDGVEDVHVKIMCSLRKDGDRLTANFTGTDPQAAGGINCTRPGLEGAVVSALFSMLCYDLPWSSAGVREIVDIETVEGMVNDAVFPAAVSMASVTGAWVTARVVGGAIGKMVGCGTEVEDEAQAMWNPAFHGIVFAGNDTAGNRVTFLALDQESGGGGARANLDGIDAGSNLHSISNAIPNVERNELVSPFLQVWRRLRTDSGGPGEHRGGCGIEVLYVPYEMADPTQLIVFSCGDDQPGAMGLRGGYPGSVQRHLVVRDSGLFEQFSAGSLPSEIGAVEGGEQELLAPKARTTLTKGDVLWTFLSGGGGYGDPLARDADSVREDVRSFLVSPEVALDVYGVGANGDDSEERRRAARAERLADAEPPAVACELDGSSADSRYSAGRGLDVLRFDSTEAVACSCGTVLAELPSDPKLGCAHRRRELTAVTALNRFGRSDLFAFDEYLCPGCGALVGTQVSPVGEDELFADLEISPGHALP